MFTYTKLPSGFMLTYLKAIQWFHTFKIKSFSGFMLTDVRKGQWFHANKC